MRILMCPAIKAKNTNTRGNCLYKHLVLMITFQLFYAGVDGVKVVHNSRQHGDILEVLESCQA
jgi:hypothetical protein